MRLIDADAMKDRISGEMQSELESKDSVKRFVSVMTESMIKTELDKEPTVDAEPVKHGHWMTLGEKRGDPSYHSHMHEYWCSACDICIGGEISHYEYCPHCGALMDEEVQDETAEN